MASKPKSERELIDSEILRRFLGGTGVHTITVSIRYRDEWWGQSEKRVEAVLRRALKKGLKRGRKP